MSYKRRADFNGHRILTNLQEGGKWYELLQYVCDNACPNNLDDGLDVHLRSDCVHIYYKGGRILEIKTDVLHIDPNYFYKREDFDNIPRTHMEFIRDDKKEELERRSVTYIGWTKERAKEVFESLEKKRDQLFGLEKSDRSSHYQAFCDIAKDPKRYFDSAKKVMDAWSRSLETVSTHLERMLQQRISIINRDKKRAEFIVIDIEFSVSGAQDCPFGSNQFTHPRFDIIAIQPKENNKLVVIELKRGLGSVGMTEDGEFDVNTKSGVINHLNKFNATVGNDKNYKGFIAEMQGVLDMKVKLGILPNDLKGITISKEKPDFMLAYAGEGMEQFLYACQKENLKCIRIENEKEPFLKL